MTKTIIAILFMLYAHTNAQNGEVLIIYTNNTNGILENCRCPERSYGALEKRAALIDNLRKTHPNVLLLDCGDILDIRPNHLLHTYIVRAYERIGYDAWTPGDQDFIEGLDFFKQQLLTMPGKVVSANLAIDGKEVGISWWRADLAGIKFGVTGITDPGLIRYLPESISHRISINNVDQALEKVLSDAKNKVDIIVLLSHAGFEKDFEIATRIPEIDLIVGGHSQTILERPEIVGKTMIVQAGEGGNRVGLLKLAIEAGKISSYHNSLHLLLKKDRDDPKVLELITAYHSERMKTIKLNDK